MPEVFYCSKCKKEFSCGRNDEKCWCNEITIDKEDLNHLSKKFEGCLCRECLSKFTEQE